MAMTDKELAQRISDAVAEERAATVKWLREVADECPVAQVADLFRHEANGLENGLHRMGSN